MSNKTVFIIYFMIWFMKIFCFLQCIKFIFCCCNYNAFFHFTWVPRMFRFCHKCTTDWKQCEEHWYRKTQWNSKTSFAIESFHVYHGGVVFPLQGSISSLYGNKSVRSSVVHRARRWWHWSIEVGSVLCHVVCGHNCQ